MKTALSIAGSDCSGGAGIQADLKTMIMNSVYGMSVITSLTAQNTTGVTGISEVSPDFLGQQIDAVFTDIFPDAVKIGMVPSGELMEVIAERLGFYKAQNIVLDPVMISTSGSVLMQNKALSTLKKRLLPMAALLTPNIPEAQVLAESYIENSADMERAAEKIYSSYGCNVLLKGGHRLNDANDLLLLNGKKQWIEGRKIDNPNTHGTGCTLSSAIASNLANGKDIFTSVKNAKDYISCTLSAKLDLGAGRGPLDHGYILNGGCV